MCQPKPGAQGPEVVHPSIEIYDTTLRDGAQREGISFSVEDKRRILLRLDELGIAFVEGGWPGSNPKDVEFFALARKLTLKQTRLAAFGSTRRPQTRAENDRNLQLLLEAETPVVTIFGKSWDLHVTEALRTTLDENLRMIEESVAFLAGRGREVIYDAEHFFDGFRKNPEYALKTLQAAVRGGASRIVLCDTNGGSLPEQIREAVLAVRRALGDGIPLGIHCHNDGGLGVANSLAAVAAGCTHVQGTINGLGERCGNADLCQVIPNLQLKLGYRCLPEEAIRTLTEVSRFVDEIANLNPDPHRPFVGASAFAHKGGIHVSAVLRDPSTYEHISPEQVGNRRKVLVSELAGKSNVLYKARELGVIGAKAGTGARSETEPEAEIDPARLQQVLSQIKELEYAGYQFEGAEGSFELLLHRALGNYRPFFELIGFRLVIEKRSPMEEPLSEATIKVRVGDRVLHTAADGDGPVNALDNALRKALEEVYPELARFKLTDYKVRVLDEKKGTAATVRVLIESADNGRRWGTVGVSSNIIEASWQALVDSIEYGLLKSTTAEPRQEADRQRPS
ncbi:MAG: citramalate synthase [Limnochordales bacterium]|nr:citramalate synthase [Limnochordales bacterium]